MRNSIWYVTFKRVLLESKDRIVRALGKQRELDILDTMSRLIAHNVGVVECLTPHIDERAFNVARSFQLNFHSGDAYVLSPLCRVLIDKFTRMRTHRRQFRHIRIRAAS